MCLEYNKSNVVAVTAGQGYINVNSGNANTFLAFTGNVTIDNMTLYLAVEKNQEIINSLREKILSQEGFSVLIPYVHQYKNNLIGSSQTVSLRFNRGHGRRLVKIYHSVFNQNEIVTTGAATTANNQFIFPTAYDNDNRNYTLTVVKATAANNINYNRSKVQIFYTMLDNERLQEFNMSCANYDDYMQMRDKLKGSVLQDADIYYYNWVWIEDFTNNLNKCESDNDTKEVGLDL